MRNSFAEEITRLGKINKKILYSQEILEIDFLTILESSIRKGFITVE